MKTARHKQKKKKKETFPFSSASASASVASENQALDTLDLGIPSGSNAYDFLSRSSLETNLGKLARFIKA